MKILIPLDGSEFAEAALKPVAELVGSSGAEVHLIQIVGPAEATVDWRRRSSVEPHSRSDAAGASALIGVDIAGTYGGHIYEEVGGFHIESSGQGDERLRTEAKDYLESVSHRFFPAGATTVAVTGDNPGAEIREYASNESIDLIAIATHGRTGLARLMMGSVASDLLKDYVAPVLMVRPDGLKS